MAQVIQAKCPHCSNVLRIPADWLDKAMRCKFCKNTFQAKAKNPAPPPPAGLAAGAPPMKPSAPIPVAKPAGSVPIGKPASAFPVSKPAPPAAPLAKPAALASPAAAPSGVQATAPLPAPRPISSSSDPFAFPDADPSTPPPPSVAKPRKKGNGTLMMVFAFLFLFVVGAGGAGIVVYKVATTSPVPVPPKQVASTDGAPAVPVGDRSDPLPKKDIREYIPPMKSDGTPVRPSDDGSIKKPILPKRDAMRKDLVRKDGGKKAPPVGSDPFPRRALLISVNHYLMFSTVHYGSGQDMFKGGYPGSSTGVLRDRLTRPPWYFPFTQVTELSDGIPEKSGAKAHPTQKSVIQTTITDFVDSSRDQDRVIVFFAGHACSVDGKSYLIPIDGNMADTSSLIELKWVYDELARCRAQQKILVLDTFRFSPGRGFEFPSAGEGDEGTMPEAFDKDLQNPPPGVLVWSACQKDQSSVEFEGGSAFMQALCHSMLGTIEMTGISAPTQPIPIESLVVKVNQRLKELVGSEKRNQMSRLTGKAGEREVAYNSAEPLPTALVLKPPTVAGDDAAGFALVDNILAEMLMLPPVRDTRAGDINLLKARNLPAFSAKKLDGYKQTGYQNVSELINRHKAGKEAYAKEFPLRAAIFDVVEGLQESSRISTREVLPGPINPKSKAAFLLEQSGPGISIFKLEQLLAQFNEAGEEREKETSKRWQANFDYTQARLQSRLVYLFEYSYTLGQIRLDALPELAPGQNGWRIGTSKRITVTESKAKALAKATSKLLKRMQDEYPGTPWALLAQRESMIAVGLQWRAKSD